MSQILTFHVIILTMALITMQKLNRYFVLSYAVALNIGHRKAWFLCSKILHCACINACHGWQTLFHKNCIFFAKNRGCICAFLNSGFLSHRISISIKNWLCIYQIGLFSLRETNMQIHFEESITCPRRNEVGKQFSPYREDISGRE